METRYCIEYVNPRHPLRDNGSINVRYDRVLTLEQAIHDLTLIKSFGAKILNLYMGNVVDGKTGEWNPVPMIVDEDDWFTTDWLKSLNKLIEVKEADLEKEFDGYIKPITAQDIKDEPFTQLFACAKHFYELGLKAKGE